MATRVQHKSKKKSFTSEEDIVELILHDHKALKEYLRILKDDENSFEVLKEAFEDFAPALKIHAKSEEQTWYQRLKELGDLDCVHGLEGDVEHKLADQLCQEMRDMEDENLFKAKAKVLAELVEHHLKEEESHFLPEFRKRSTIDERIELGLQYLQLRFEFEEAEKGHFATNPSPPDLPSVSEIV